MKKICKLTSLLMIVILSLAVATGCGSDSKDTSEAATTPSEEVSVQEYSVPITIINDTGVEIYGIYASIADADTWEENLLTSGSFANAASAEITFNFTDEQLVWDFALEDVDGTTIEFYGLDFTGCSTEGIVLDFTYDATTGQGTVYWK